MPDTRILVVDDEPAIVQLCTHTLSQNGYAVQSATSGQEAIALLEENAFDLLLVDVVIPDVSGLAILRRGREIAPDLAAVVMTGYATLDSTVEALNAGVHRFVLKPFDIKELLQAVRDALAQKQREQEHLCLRAQLPILEIGQALAAEGQVDHLAGRLLEVVTRQMGADQAALLSLDQKTGQLTLVKALGLPAGMMDRIHHLLDQARTAPPLPGEIPLVFGQGSPLEPPWQAVLPGFQGEIVLASLRTTKRMWGTLVLSRSANRATPTPSELNLLSIVSDQIATTLENARLYEAVQRELAERKRAEEQLRRYADRLSILHQIDQGILSAQSPEDIAQAALSRIRQLIPCERATVVLFEPTIPELVILTTNMDVATTFDTGRHIPLDQAGDIRELLLQGQVVVIDDLSSRGPILQVLYQEGIRVFVAVPLLAQGDLIGSLNFSLVDALSFTKENEAIACQVADQLAIALQQARLLEEIQRHAEELEQRVADRTLELSQANQELERVNVQLTREIGERKRVEVELRESEEKYRSLVFNIPDVIWTMDDVGSILFISPNVENVYGYTPEEIYRTGDELRSKRIHPDDIARVRQAFKSLFAQGAAYDVEYRIQHREGHWIWLHDKAIATYQEGSRVYADGAFSDITARKQAEESLQQERDFITAVLDTAGALVVVLDRKGRIVRFNRACEKLTGYSLNEVTGKCFWDLFLVSEEVDSVKAVFEELRDGQFPNEHENYWRARDGGQQLISWSNTCLLDTEGEVEYIIATGINIGEARKWL